MPRKRLTKTKVQSPKAKPGKKAEKLDENGTLNKKRANDTNDEPAPKKVKVDSKASKSTDKTTDASTAKKAKNEPKQMQNKTDTNLDEIDFECAKINEEGKKYNLKICTWNVSGIRAVIKKNGIDYIAKEDADIFALQETKCDKDKMPDEIKLPGYNHYFVDSKKPGYCGVALFSKEKPISVKYGLNNSTFDIEGRMITAEFPEFFVINVYVPNAGQKLVTLPKRLEWNKVFKKHIQELDQKKPVIICGDMNVAHQEIDLKNPKTNTKNAGFTKEERDDMTDFLAAGFTDTFRLLYPDTEGAYTFWSYFANARGKNIGWRLDYFLTSERIKNKVCDNIIRKQVYGSDHCPVILYLNL
ncbi:PREDICTED: DNA-(apurinic or apyrimidinic site) lyase [Wasmannia auropunctata]|uniref:DNA-(apurinic or apyrimidinic site) lyase n=1 Tax=Wasmannia auropunctata TaxID=64793 RepID=UPI0005EE7EA1|nr:PREDICTED: DNA-(apurinic or apyrimidinic site) lyase [Wasmannia auropunctata]XP_011692240.1 PREDICTED: DNA-(apurinic or apyrimidinic site) lyase [Wasmannia auropunctata]XP_011692241.1 PREDICTED: DNA-(apurinic or apyrimidinic site) lyase [Wasmannia auropunctata]